MTRALGQSGLQCKPKGWLGAIGVQRSAEALGDMRASDRESRAIHPPAVVGPGVA
ncbi:MAG: hypothetical protein AAGF79_19850 [Pseudomonadota bacterium]